MKHLRAVQPFVFSVLIVLIYSSGAQAQMAKVIKVKGHQAIIQFPAGTKPEVGQLLAIPANGDDAEEKGRLFLLGWDASVTSLSTNSGTGTDTSTGLTTSGRFGWNMGDIEAGPLGTFAYLSGSQSTHTMQVGGFLDYNLIPNVNRVKLVYGYTGSLEIGQSTITSSTTESTNSILSVFGGGQLKWFGLSDLTAVRVDAGYLLTRTAYNGAATNISGLQVTFGFSTYF